MSKNWWIGIPVEEFWTERHDTQTKWAYLIEGRRIDIVTCGGLVHCQGGVIQEESILILQSLARW
jgi:hypothetical protein